MTSVTFGPSSSIAGVRRWPIYLDGGLVGYIMREWIGAYRVRWLIEEGEHIGPLFTAGTIRPVQTRVRAALLDAFPPLNEDALIERDLRAASYGDTR